MSRIIHNKVQNDTIEFLHLSTDASDNDSTVFKATFFPNGMGVGLHKHMSMSEDIRCLEGEISLILKDKKIKLSPSESFLVEPNTYHSIKNESDRPCTILCTVTPANRNLELALQIGYGLANDDKTDKYGVPGLKNLCLLMGLSDIHISGFRSIINPIAKYIYRTTPKSYMNTLIEKYVKY